MMRVPGSSISASIASGVVTSASLPVESATRKPMPRAVQLISTEKPKPPLCDTSDTEPASSSGSWNTEPKPA